MNKENVLQAIINMNNSAKELWIPTTIPELFKSPNSQKFIKDFVSRNIPVIIRNGCSHWESILKWDKKYLIKTVTNEVTVALSNNGLSDSIIEFNGKQYFILPYEKKMNLNDYFNSKFIDKKSISYIQNQCSSLTEEMSILKDDISELEWAKNALGNLDATNIWIGDSDAISSLHKDPYENIYCVVKGVKHFTLYPPTDSTFLYRRKYPTARFTATMQIEIINENETVPWCSVNPDDPDLTRYPLFKHATPLRVEVREGDVLYLPAQWFHQVKQDDGTVAVNFWYDMAFDARYTWATFQEEISSLIT